MFGIDFNFLRKTREQLCEKREKMLVELEDLRRQRDQILRAPGSKEELKKLLGGWVVSQSEQYRQQLRETLMKFSVGARSMSSENLVNLMSLAGPPPLHGGVVQTVDVDRALCGLFGPLLKKALDEEIQGMEWPSNSLTSEERQAQADSLSERIDKLDKELNDLNAAAEEAGVEWPRVGYFK